MEKATLFSRDNTLLVVVDVQTKLADTMDRKERVVRNIGKLIRVAKELQLPIVVTEQYPKGLGKTLPELESLLIDAEPIEKVTFSCCMEERFINALAIENRRNILITGMEAHICVMQTALDLLNREYTAGIVQDAVCSYNQNDMDIAMMRMRGSGVLMTTTEMIIYELLRTAGTEEFKKLLPILKDR